MPPGSRVTAQHAIGILLATSAFQFTIIIILDKMVLSNSVTIFKNGFCKGRFWGHPLISGT